ncbi:hypothetical protein IMG5_014070 [Ichthyophthirius multifiliis]|uniref:Ras family protein n=1 Tax=Ichthyophthirius multifiliis TaxID=5932 RepID=G0QK80_ICHMU|nr:hypothetical protein IMG5_014070 [Ichthyophthirius multifiliis]EGR34378.1 hypothetical protein IMG5_014070 [Ichthyophthirius multifiliis]|eukprot:XP_004039682.1 hypothetical protein IMG5_014070 [Ichthyophthirius multifiliis]
MNKYVDENAAFEDTYKIVLVGDTNVGKTHLLKRFIKNNLACSVAPTIGVEFQAKTIQLKDGKIIKVQFWDTAGQERYRSITSFHYRKALGALLVYDITKENTFNSVQKWIDEIKNQSSSDIIIMLVGNKLDLVQNNPSFRKVSKEDAKNISLEHKMFFEETSALTSNNVDQTFEKLLNVQNLQFQQLEQQYENKLCILQLKFQDQIKESQELTINTDSEIKLNEFFEFQNIKYDDIIEFLLIQKSDDQEQIAKSDLIIIETIQIDLENQKKIILQQNDQNILEINISLLLNSNQKAEEAPEPEHQKNQNRQENSKQSSQNSLQKKINNDQSSILPKIKAEYSHLIQNSILDQSKQIYGYGISHYQSASSLQHSIQYVSFPKEKRFAVKTDQLNTGNDSVVCLPSIFDNSQKQKNKKILFGLKKKKKKEKDLLQVMVINLYYQTMYQKTLNKILLLVNMMKIKQNKTKIKKTKGQHLEQAVNVIKKFTFQDLNRQILKMLRIYQDLINILKQLYSGKINILVFLQQGNSN